jgi:hypothetical protein
MPQAVAVTVYNFVQAAVLSATNSAILASNVGQAFAAAASAATKVALLASVSAVVANNSKPEQTGGLTSLTISPNEPRRLQIGKRDNAGVLVDWYVRGSKNQNLYLVIYLGEGPMGRITKVKAGGRTVYTSPINHGVRTTIPDFRSGGDRLWVTYYDGRPGQTADSNLVSQGLGWNSNCVGEGCAYAIVEMQWDSDNLRSPVSMSFEIEGAKLYDRRKDSTAGGSGSHRIDNPATWELSANPMVALDHYVLGRRVGSIKTFGIGLDPDDFPYSRFAAQANLCDENVALSGGGTQKRYEANGFLFADRIFADTIKDLCRAMNARPADFGGMLGILDGQSKTPVLEITDEDVIETAAEEYSPKKSWNELVNDITGSYINPAQNYQPTPYERISDAAWVSADGGSLKQGQIDFEFETNGIRAQRLAWLYGNRERRQAQLTGVYKLRTIELEQGDWFTRSGGIFGAGKVFEVINRVLDPSTMTVTITAFEVDPSDSAWVSGNEQALPSDPSDDENVLSPTEVPTFGVYAFTLTGVATSRPAMQFSWDAPTDPSVRQILIEVAPQDPGADEIMSFIADAQSLRGTLTSGIADEVPYYVRARFIGVGAPSEWTSTFEVTTEGTYDLGEPTAVDWSTIYGPGTPEDNATVGATAGENIYRPPGTILGLADIETYLGTAAGITGQGAFATLSAISAAIANANNLLRFTAGGLFYGDLDADLTAGNTAAGIIGQGAFATLSAISAALANANNLLRFTAGGLFYGDLNADLTAGNTAAGITGQGGLATRNDVDFAQIVGGAVNGGSAAETAGSLTSTGSWQTSQSLTVSVPAGTQFVKIDFQMFAQALGTQFHQAPSTLEARIVRQGTQIWYGQIARVSGPVTAFSESGGTVSIGSEGVIIPQSYYGVLNGFDIDSSPVAGTITYVLQIRRLAVSGEPNRASWTISDRKMFVDVRKR